MPYAELVNGRIDITSPFRDRELIKLLPGGKWDTTAQTWWAPLSWATCIQLRGIFGQELQIGPNLSVWSRNEKSTRVTPCLALRMAEDSSDGISTEGLRPFQRAGVVFLSTARNALLADEMGLGKTVQAIAAAEEIGDEAYPLLVVAPNSMKFTWEKEYKTWAPRRRVIVIQGGKVTRQKQIHAFKDGEFDVAVINWEGLRGHTRLDGYGSLSLSDEEKRPKELNEITIKTVIADEAHKAKDPRSKQTRALWWVSKHAENRFALTGTPIANSPEDAWSIMRFVAPEEWPAKTKFIERYALQSWNMFGGMEICGLKSETRDELFSILDPRFIRRTKAAVMPQLPPKTYSTRDVELSPKQRKAYDSIRKEMIVDLETGVLVAINPLARMVRLLQFASAYGEIGEDGNLLLTEPSCKIDALEEIVEELGGEQAIVFAESRQLIELAYKRLIRAKPHGLGLSVGLITGKVDPHARAEAVTDFNSKKHQLMLMTLATGGVGLSFPGCSTAIFLQRSFNFVYNTQAEDRIHGIGRGVEGVPSTIIDVISVGTVEERVHEARIEKGEKLEEFARDEETLKAWLSK